jgi:choline transport protein
MAAPFGNLVILFPISCTTNPYLHNRRPHPLARDDATPFPYTLSRISPLFKNPFNATLACGISTSILGCIYVGSRTAFNALVSSFVVLSTLSYLATILPFISTRRFSRSMSEGGNAMVPGPYQMGHFVGYTVNIISCAYIVVFIVVYCFPYSLPVAASNMNYSCLITGRLTIFAYCWWLWRGGGYIRPQALVHEWVATGNVVAQVNRNGKW